MTRRSHLWVWLWLSCLASVSAQATSLPAQEAKSIETTGGLKLLVAEENAQPTLRIVLPGHPETDRAIEVLFPEHVTARRNGSTAPERLYIFRPGPRGERPTWRRVGRSLEYERELPGKVHMLARATLEDDGVRFHYEFNNRSDVAYDMIYAVTDPRLTSMFHDVRLERTYVHHTDGFELLAEESRTATQLFEIGARGGAGAEGYASVTSSSGGLRARSST